MLGVVQSSTIREKGEYIERGEVMARRKKTKREIKQAQWDREKKDIQTYRSLSPFVKKHLKNKGLRWSFYEFLDSAKDEFDKICQEAKDAHPTLWGVFEVDPDELDKRDWSKYDIPNNWTLIEYTREANPLLETYGEDSDQDLRGNTVAFKDPEGKPHTLIRISKVVGGVRHKEYKYLFKIPVLLHEIGHVQDVEQKVNFDIEKKTCSIIEAEVYANLYAFDQCVQRNYPMSYDDWVEKWEACKECGDYRGEVARQTLDRLPAEQPIRWQNLIDEQQLKDLAKQKRKDDLTLLRMYRNS
jgi:hypothetical protein